jgi:Tfp pilus assembly protein FimT
MISGFEPPAAMGALTHNEVGMFNQKGFTIKELLMVFVVIAILCLAAIPPFFMLQQSRREANIKKTTNELQAPTPSSQ